LSQRVERDEPLHLLVDSTGVKIYGEGEWLDQKHGVRSRRRRCKLHLAVDADTQEIAAVELTPDDVGDVSALPDLLDQIEGPVGSVTADGAYDGDTVYDDVLQRHPVARVIIPPRSTAVLSNAGTTQRDDHLRTIEDHGRLGWQRRSLYGRRSLVETAMYRCKIIIGRRLHARSLLNQKAEAKIACNVLNRMTSLGMPISVRIK
jgi:transposase